MQPVTKGLLKIISEGKTSPHMRACGFLVAEVHRPNSLEPGGMVRFVATGRALPNSVNDPNSRNVATAAEYWNTQLPGNVEWLGGRDIWLRNSDAQKIKKMLFNECSPLGESWTHADDPGLHAILDVFGLTDRSNEKMGVEGIKNHTWSLEDDEALQAIMENSDELFDHYKQQGAGTKRCWDMVAGTLYAQTESVVTGGACQRRWTKLRKQAAPNDCIYKKLEAIEGMCAAIRRDLQGREGEL